VAIAVTTASSDRQDGSDDDGPIDRRSLIKPTSSGCLMIVGSALLSCILLFFNGGFIMALLHAFADQGWTFTNDDRITQFIVLIGPVLLLIIQWMILDYLWARLRRRR
jgi:hypothetical protein